MSYLSITYKATLTPHSRLENNNNFRVRVLRGGYIEDLLVMQKVQEIFSKQLEFFKEKHSKFSSSEKNHFEEELFHYLPVLKKISEIPFEILERTTPSLQRSVFYVLENQEKVIYGCGVMDEYCSELYYLVSSPINNLTLRSLTRESPLVFLPPLSCSSRKEGVPNFELSPPLKGVASAIIQNIALEIVKNRHRISFALHSTTSSLNFFLKKGFKQMNSKAPERLILSIQQTCILLLERTELTLRKRVFTPLKKTTLNEKIDSFPTFEMEKLIGKNKLPSSPFHTDYTPII
ncbi:hypothetical protein AB751O23_AX_00010, partial [Chlamydiales bacterium SCGC AB-751-O23]